MTSLFFSSVCPVEFSTQSSGSHAQWRGKSGLNAHADFVMQTDDSFGQLLRPLNRGSSTIHSSFRRPSTTASSPVFPSCPNLQQLGHFPSGDLRGSKADIWDGGHRVPFIVSWPQRVAPSTRRANLVCLTDVLATVAEIVGQPLPTNAGEDSVSFLTSLLSKPEEGRPTSSDTKHVRHDVIHHSISGYFAIRRDNWKLCVCPDSGGWTDPKPSAKAWAVREQAQQPLLQLYDMTQDIGEQSNRVQEQPEIVQQLLALLHHQVLHGLMSPGPDQKNDFAVTVEKRPGNEASTNKALE